MQRRNVLKGLAAVAVLSSFGPAIGAPFRRVRPGDPGWPSSQEWEVLKADVGGSLTAVEPLFGACRSDPQGGSCGGTEQNIHNPFFIGDQAAGTQTSGWLDAWMSAPSVYAVKARHAADVAAAVNFARTHNLRLAVKGGGHSYQGTSNAADSLLIWTRAMNDVSLHRGFVGAGCEGRINQQPAVSAGAGAMWVDLYHAVTSEAGRYVQGGGCTSVGVAGLVQSGGFGSFSKGFGTAASGLLEAEIVTADGRILIANPCQNADLFWALKGGGGGSWGVVTRLTLRTHELPRHFGAARGRIKARSDAAFVELLARFFHFYADNLLNSHWGEQIAIGPDNSLKISMVCQGLDETDVQSAWRPFFDWAAASHDDFEITDPLHAHAIDSRHWWDIIKANPSMVADKREGAPPHHGWWDGDAEQVGVYLHGYDSLWLPESLLREQEGRVLVQALFSGSRFKTIGLHFNKGLAGAPPEAIAAAKDTATNPAVTEAFALAIIADGEAPAFPGESRVPIDQNRARQDADAITSAAASLRKIVSQPGSYVSESNYFNRNWQAEYWGANHARLAAIKAKYDPDGLFTVHHGVGSEAWSDDGFTRRG
jgi:FAD/FMN-containing dehydrogenase